MSELRSNRRYQAQIDLGLTDEHERAEIERAARQELRRKHEKEERRREIEESSSYRSVKTIAKWMDSYFLDPIIGFLLPAGTGDALTSIFVFPYIYVAASQMLH